MSDPDSRSDSLEDAWLDWLEAVGLSKTFPVLLPLLHPAEDRDEYGKGVPTEDSKKWFLNRQHLLAIREILDSLGAAQAITTSPGHGATSLARYVYQTAENETIIRRAIPVFVSLEQFVKPDYMTLLRESQGAIDRAVSGQLGYPYDGADAAQRDEDALYDLKQEAERRAEAAFDGISAGKLRVAIEEAIRSAVVRSLVTKPWERAMPRARYRDLIAADSPQAADLQAKRDELTPYVSAQSDPESQKKVLARLAPRLVPDETRELLAELDDASRVRIVLILDLSATPAGRFYAGEPEGEYLTDAYRTVLSRFATAIKNIEQGGLEQPVPTLPSLLDKTYFMSKGAWEEFDRNNTKQDQDPLEFPPLRPIDVFAMLAYHYPTHQEDNGRRAEVLAAVLDSRFVEITEGRGITTEMALLRAKLIENAAQQGDATYQMRREVPHPAFNVPQLAKLLFEIMKIAEQAREEGNDELTFDTVLERVQSELEEGGEGMSWR